MNDPNKKALLEAVKRRKAGMKMDQMSIPDSKKIENFESPPPAPKKVPT